MRIIVLAVVSVCTLAAGIAQAEIFKWKDANGKIHYTDTPPPDNPKKDVTGKLQDPGCDKECQDNVKKQSDYRQLYLQQKSQEARDLKSRSDQHDRETSQAAQARESQLARERQEAESRSQRERGRVPSQSSRQP